MPAAREWVTPSSHAKKKKVKFTKSAASPNPNRDTAPPSTGAKPGPRGKTTNPFAPLGEKTSSESSGNPPETQDEAEDESPTDETLPNFEKRSTGPPKPPSPAIEEGEVVSSDADIPDSVARALLDALQEKRQGNQLPTAMAPLARVRASQLQHCIDNKTEPSESTIQATLDIVAMESGPADPAALSDKVSLKSSPFPPRDIPPELEDELFSRNRLFFEEGFEGIRSASVIVVGLRGVGSHAAHMLVHRASNNCGLSTSIRCRCRR